MMESNKNNRQNKIKQTILVLIVIFTFTLLVGGISYAYFGVYFNNQVTLVSVFLPRAEDIEQAINRTLRITPTSCSMNINYAKMTSNNLTYNESSTCSLNIALNGAVGDYCTFNVNAIPYNSNTKYIKSSSLTSSEHEFTATVSITTYNESTGITDSSYSESPVDVDAMNNGYMISSDDYNKLTITQMNKMVYIKYNVDFNFYNLNKDQSGLLSDSNTTLYSYKLKVQDLRCSFNT